MENKPISISDFINSIFGKSEPFPLKTEVKHLKKGTILLDAGTLQTENYFVQEGVIQASATVNNDEKIFEFITENEFAGEFSFFIPQKPSLYGLTCITDCTLEVFPIDEYAKELDDSFFLNKLTRYILEYWYVKRIKKEMSMTVYQAEDRYKRLFTSRPELIQQLPLVKIARYLNVHPNSLSRIRKTLYDEK